MSLLNRITRAAVAVIAAVAISPVIITAHADHDDERYDPPGVLADMLPMQTDFKMMMNYELGMHCTGFEFAYCCVLPVYNSILAQVVKPQNGDSDFPHLLEADPRENTAADVLGRHTVLRDPAELDRDDNFQKYVLRYWHDAQPRDEGNGKPQSTTLISNVEGNSLMSWNTAADSAKIVGFSDPCTYDADGNLTGYNRGAVETGDYNGSEGVVLGDGDFDDSGCTFGVPIDNYQNVVWNHLYIKEISARGVEGFGGNTGGNSPEAEKYRLGVHVDYPTNFGPAGHNMEGLLTFSGDHGTVVFTQMKVLEDLPVTLTSPRIWEALGLPLTPFEDTIDFFGDPGLVDEDSIRPYVQMKAQLYHANCDGAGTCTEGDAVLNRRGDPIIGFGTAPIDIPNCERCHSAFDDPNDPDVTAPNSPNVIGVNPEAALVQAEIDFWNMLYGIDTGAGDSDWYSRLKGAAVSILVMHDAEHGTGFLDNYAVTDPGGNATFAADLPLRCSTGLVGNYCAANGDCDTAPGANDGMCEVLPQVTRIGHESVICQKCHADSVIAVVKSANCGPDQNCDVTDPRNELFSNIAPGSMLIPPLTEAIHINHRDVTEVIDGEPGVISFNDAEGRSGGCQGCHPAHRSDGNMADYPIDLNGNNTFANADNRDATGGCFVGRDVHSNPLKDIDGAETPEHLNPIGQWLSDNVYNNQGANGNKGIWCTNCHSQVGQQMWKAENVADLVNANPGDAGHVREPGDFNNDGAIDERDVFAAVNAALGTTTSDQTFMNWLDPGAPNANAPWRTEDLTSAIWQEDPGMCNHAASLLGLAEASPYQDGNVATIEINMVAGDQCTTGIGLPGPDCFGTGNPSFYICGSLDVDNDVNVALTAAEGESPFCTTPDCVAAAQATLNGGIPPISYGGDGTPSLDNLEINGDGQVAVPVPVSAASDGRDHWLAPGEPHCADCHAAPYVEQSGNINAFAPFNYPRKASLMRYSRGHQDITCQGCHESIHGLYPVTPPGLFGDKAIDTTSYWQAASLNDDHSHGPLKCGTCHETNSRGVWKEAEDLEYNGVRIERNLDAAISWMHTFTEEADPRVDFCQNCHGDETGEMRNGDGWEEEWLEHARRGRASRNAMDKVEILEVGHVAGDPAFEDPLDTVCVGCHSDESDEISCDRSDGREWKEHLTEGRVSMSVWEYVSLNSPGTGNTTCGW